MSADPGELAVDQFGNEVIQPIFICAAVGIRERHDFTRRRRNASVACLGEAEVGVMAEVADIRELLRDLRRRIG